MAAATRSREAALDDPPQGRPATRCTHSTLRREKLSGALPRGGSVASHPALADGRLYWGSGFGQFTGVAGNKLFVFSIDGR